SIYTLARSTEEYRALQIHQTVRNESIQKHSRALIPCTIVDCVSKASRGTAVAVTHHVLHRMRHTPAIQCPKSPRKYRAQLSPSVISSQSLSRLPPNTNLA